MSSPKLTMAEERQNLVELLTSMKLVYRNHVTIKVTAKDIQRALASQLSDSELPSGSDLAATITAEVTQTADSHDENVDQMVEHVESEDWSVKRGNEGLKVLEEDVKTIQTEIKQKKALIVAMVTGMTESQRRVVSADNQLVELIRKVASDAI